MRRIRVEADGEAHEVTLGTDHVVVDGQKVAVAVEGDGPDFRVRIGKRTLAVHIGEEGVRIDHVPLQVAVRALPPEGAKGAKHGASGKGPVHPPLPGRVVAVKVQPGQEVKAGQCLVVLDAMKMQNEVPAPADGKVAEVKVAEGQLVDPKDVLVVLG